MRAIGSCLKLANDHHIHVDIRWTRYAGLNARYEDLFMPFASLTAELKENDSWLLQINRRSDYIKRLPLLLLKYDKVLFEPAVNRKALDEVWTMASNNNHRNVLIISGAPLCSDYTLDNIFKPTASIQSRIDQTVGTFNGHTIGMHIRRTDNVESINGSPIEAFEREIKKETAADPQTTFYLACDDNQVKNDLLQKYGPHIITFLDDSARDSLEGMQFAVFDLFCLSQTTRIIGSYYSSYSQEAARIGHTPLSYARKK